MQTDYTTAKEQLTRIAAGFSELAPPEQGPVWEKFDNVIDGLVKERGWHRRMVWELVDDILGTERDRLATEARDALVDYLLALEGDVHPDFIPRLPGEPEDQQAFLTYVRSKRWLRNQ